MRCFVCDSPKLVEDRSYYDIQGYHYGLCEHSEDIGTQMECPSESTACGKLVIRADKSKVVNIFMEHTGQLTSDLITLKKAWSQLPYTLLDECQIEKGIWLIVCPMTTTLFGSIF